MKSISKATKRGHRSTPGSSNPNKPDLPIVVIGSQFVVPHPLELKIETKGFKLGENSFSVSDNNGKLYFELKGKLFSLRDRKILFDADGTPLVSLKQKMISVHRRWQVFKGESSNPHNVLFSVRKASVIKFKPTWDIFLATNSTENEPDFKIKGNWYQTGCSVYAGDNIIAEMKRKRSLQTLVMDTEQYELTTYPDVDYAFIVTLVMILDEINTNKRTEKNSNGAVGAENSNDRGDADAKSDNHT